MSHSPQLLFQQGDIEVVQSSINDIDIVNIKHPLCQASVSLYAGHVLSWQPTGHDEVFWLSDDTSYQQGKAIRGGIPLCWPWFGPKQDEVNHGFARTSQWQLTSVKADNEGVELTLLFGGQGLATTWPYQFEVEQKLYFGQDFKQSLKIDNLGNEPFEHTGALHSYFKVGEPSKVSVSKLNNVAFFDKLSDQIVTEPMVDCRGPKDRVYQTNQNLELIDNKLARIISLSTTGTSSWILWNPGEEVAQGMSDVHLGAEKEFVCLEAGFTEPLVLASRNSYTISQHIEIRRL
ncbi:D-hexose-6-phosphate mutarotase [Thalassotalea sp. LPB0316]|uniref:D-hexose-6-phosphate mutarotase n=1 Tax=Thalassotalea sp. LPB0316 TaxID=2769490 RepID=UPI0018693E81|nr:D-hexose-6-phosphate mutarotase [Thalassotalea sp. LPB0316]QOL25559.1 D-hexose-6-phosphate mutarotase [Thalassotalea sp. LPB0316]